MNFCLTNYSWAITWQPSYLSFFRIAHKSSASQVFYSLWCFTATSSNEPLKYVPAYYHHPNRFIPQCAFILSFFYCSDWILHCINNSLPVLFSVLLWDNSLIPQNNDTSLEFWRNLCLFSIDILHQSKIKHVKYEKIRVKIM